MIKMEIRIFSIRFAKRNAEEKRDMEFELLQKLQDLNAPLANEAKKKKLNQIKWPRRKPEVVLSEAELDSMNQEKYVIYIFSTFRKEVTTKDT